MRFPVQLAAVSGYILPGEASNSGPGHACHRFGAEIVRIKGSMWF